MSTPTLQQRLWSSLRESMGTPVGIQSWVGEHASPSRELLAGLQRGGISQAWVPAWHHLGDGAGSAMRAHRTKGELWGWQPDSTQYISVRLKCPALLALEHQVTRRVTVDIQAIEGMAASKSELTDVATMRDFALQHCPDWIQNVSLQSLYLNLAHDQVRIVRPETTNDSLAVYAWDGRVFLSNAGGSHHFATAQYIAAELRVDVPIEATLILTSLNPSAVAALGHQFTMLLVDDLYGSLHDAMRSFGAAYYAIDLPVSPEMRRSSTAHVVFLPRDNARSRRVASVMLDGGVPDVGEHLAQLVARQPGCNTKLDALDRTGEPGFNNAALRQCIEQAVEERLAERGLTFGQP